MLNGEIIIILIAVVGGGFPPLIWLWFWLKEDAKKPEPKPLIVATFIGGMIGVPIAYALEKSLVNMLGFDLNLYLGGYLLFIFFMLIVSVEEFIKYFAARLIAFPNRYFDEPIDAMVYLISAALGFAALENILFFIGSLPDLTLFDFSSIPVKDLNIIIANNNMRFIGANILHVVTSGILGFFIGLSFYRGRFVKFVYILIGLSTGILLHTIFNFSIITYSTSPLIIFMFLWVVALVMILLFEKVKRVKNRYQKITNYE